MSKSISAVMSPVELSGTKPGVDNSVKDDEAGKVPFSSLMQASDADAADAKSSGQARTGEEKAQQSSPQAPAGLTKQAVVDGQEVTERAGQLTADLREVVELADQLPDSGRPTVESAVQLPPAGTAGIQQTALATPGQDTAVPEHAAPAGPLAVVADKAIAVQQSPEVDSGVEALVKSVNAGSSETGAPAQEIVLQHVQIAMQTTTVRVPAGELPQHNAGSESVAAAVRAAVQLAVARGGGEGLQQSLTEGRNFQMDPGALATRSAVDTPVMTFADTLVATTPSTSSSRVQVPVGQQGWGRAVGEQVVWFISQNVNAASLRLNPQHLGPLEMQVNVDGDKANVAFISQHATVREALDSAMPRLREMFAESGLSLGDVQVSQHGASGQRDQEGGDTARVAGDAEDAGDTDVEGMESGARQGVAAGSGLVDYYA